ncbi:MAG: hypothetical protein ACJA0V_002831 [Planctomycetota bacterium]|jgi:hypothetical protein
MRLAPTLLAALCATSISAQAPSALFSLTSPTPGQWVMVQQHFDPLDSCCNTQLPNQAVHFVVESGKRNLVKTLLPTAVHVRDSQPFQQTFNELLASEEDAPPVAYYTVAEIEAAIDAEVALHPTLATKVNLSTLPGGQLTHEGRPIYALKVSDNVGSDEDEPAIVIAAQHHARELNAPHMVLGAMQRVLGGYATDPQIQAVVDNYEIYFVPMVNPDGVEHVWTVDEFWRKNRRDNGGNFGVDLNRNYPFLWGQCGSSTNTSSSTYRGPAAASEPETQTMRNLIATLRPEVYLDFHSSGQEVLRTYAPCANASLSTAGLIERYVDDLRGPMTYGKRDPSASGEAPEDHWASGGTMSFLIEIGTSFQPNFTETVTEEARVWPGVERVLTNWRPAVRGHVTSSQGGAPVQATITYSPNVFNHGEALKSRARDGRYGVWLPLGSWNVTFSAPNHLDTTIAVNVTNYDQPAVHDIVLTSGAQGSFVTFGQGCEGSVPAPPVSCPELNPTGGTLSNALRDNEYCYRVDNLATLTVNGFDMWSASTGGSVTVPAHIYVETNGAPEATALASTTMTVNAAPGFYTATFNPPVVITGSFYLGFDTTAQNAYINNLNSGAGGVGFYRDLANGPTNWTQSGLVQNPSWIVNCQAAGSGLVPRMSITGMPQLGMTYQPTVDDALPTTFALLLSGLSDQLHLGLPLPLPLPGAPGCDLLVAATVTELAITDASGNASLPVAVPSSASLVGLDVFHQWAIWEPTVNSLNIVVSDGGKATLGN